MSRTRQPSVAVRTFGVTFKTAQSFAYPAQGWNQLIYASRGMITVHTARGSWVLPAHRGLWVPGEIDHRIEIPGPVSLRSLYLAAGLSRKLPRDCCTVNVSPLLRELILHAVRIGALDRRVPEQNRLIGVILDQLEMLHTIPLQLPMPAEPRAAKAAKLLLADPGQRRTLGEIAEEGAAGERTLERLFRAETGMSLGSWRRRMLLLHALKLLAAGEPVTSVALTVGYDSTSAFISMFRRELGVTPGRYFD